MRALWPFLGGFIGAAIIAGVVSSVGLRRWYDRHPSIRYASSPLEARRPEINLSAVPIGGDFGGLLVMAGCVVLVLMGLPSLGWYFARSMLCAAGVAAALIFWRRAHPAGRPMRIA